MQYLKGGKFVRVTLISLWLPFSADHAHSISLSLFSLTLTEPFFAAAAFSHYIGQISLSFVAKYLLKCKFCHQQQIRLTQVFTRKYASDIQSKCLWAFTFDMCSQLPNS